MEEVRFGLVGAGQIAKCCAGQINEYPQARVVAVSDPSEERRTALKESQGIDRDYADAAELYADPEVDAVYIAVPNKFHAPLAKQALEAGKHVILDKPFALSVAEAEEVIAAAEANGKIFTLGMNQRFRDDSQKIRSLVLDGRLGEVYHAKAYWYRRSGIPKFGTWFGKKEVAGGGALLDIGVHLLDLSLYLMDNFNPVSVSGATYSKFGPRGLGEGTWGMSDRTHTDFDVDDFASALIKFENGATVALDVSWACHQELENHMNVQLFGTEAGATAYPARVFARSAEWNEHFTQEKVKANVEHRENRFVNFINTILGTEELCTTAEQALAVQKILDGIYESCATGREVRFD